jgi:hypothetical protein
MDNSSFGRLPYNMAMGTGLTAQHGPDIKLPDLLRVIAQCPKWRSMNGGCEACYSLSSRIDA